MNEIYEKAIECYIKKLEKENEQLKLFMNKTRSITFDFDGANPNKTDKDIVNAIKSLIQMFEIILDEK